MIGWRVFLWVALVVATLVFIYAVRSILLPFILATVITAILQPFIKRLRKMGLPQFLATLSAFVLFFGLAGAAISWVAPTIGDQVKGVRNRVQDYFTMLTDDSSSTNMFKRWNPVAVVQHNQNQDPIDRLLEANSGLLEKAGIPASKDAIIQQYVVPNRDKIDSQVKNFFGNSLGFLQDILKNLFFLLMVPLITWAMLSDVDGLKERSAQWIPPSIRESTIEIVSDIGHVFMGYLRGVTFAVLGYMVTMSIILMGADVPSGLLVGIGVGAIYLIPIINLPTSATIIFFVTLLSGKASIHGFHVASPTIHAAVATLIFVPCHFLYDSVVYPRMVGRSVGLHPVISFFVTLSGGALFGLVGMLIAFPLAGSVKVILDRLLQISIKGPEHLNLPAIPLRHRTS